jgi:hypothetical protein
MSWVYESLEELDLQLEFPLEEVVAPFERHIEERLKQFMVWRVFGHKADEETKWESYNADVWGFVHDEVIEYHRKNPKLFNLLSKCGKCEAWQQLNCDDLCKDCEAGVERCPNCDKITRDPESGLCNDYTCDVCREEYFCDYCIDSVEEDQGNGETRLLHRCGECLDKERTEDGKTADAVAVEIAITWGDGQKSVAQAKEAIARMETMLAEKEEAATWAALTGKTVEALSILGIASNSSASATPIAPFATPRALKEQMAAACEEAKASPAEEKPRMVVVAHYHISNQYRIPKGIDLHDKEQVECWGIKWDTLEICLKNGETIEVAPNFAINDSELKRPCDSTIEEDDNQGDDDDDA